MPGAGKTTVLTQILFNLARNDGWKFCCLFAENPIYDQVVEFLQRHFNKDIEELKGSEKEVDNMIDWLDKYFFFLDPDSDEISGWNIDSILAVAERYIDRYNDFVDKVIEDGTTPDGKNWIYYESNYS